MQEPVTNYRGIQATAIRKFVDLKEKFAELGLTLTLNNNVNVFEIGKRDIAPEITASNIDDVVHILKGYTMASKAGKIPGTAINLLSWMASDVERWEWLIKNKPQDITVFLDDNLTFVGPSVEPEDEDADSVTFDEYLGWSRGVQDLLTALGIKYEEV